MKPSHIAMDRIVEREYKTNRKYRKEIDKSERPMLRHGRKMSDEEILARLASLGLSITKEHFASLSSGFLSAEQMSLSLSNECRLKLKSFDQDWIWIGLTVLWERWQLERPSLEMIDDRIQEGYEKAHRGDSASAARVWSETWKTVLEIADARGLKSLAALDDIFLGSEFLENWIQDLEVEFWNASSDNPEFLNARIRFCEKVMQRFPKEDELILENFRRAIGESYYALGEAARTDRLFRGWLDADPEWGWGWIGWADCYTFNKPIDYDRAEEILKQGLSVPDVRDKYDLVERLADVYEEAKEKVKAREIRKQLENMNQIDADIEVDEEGRILRIRQVMDFGEEGLPLDRLPDLENALRAETPIKIDKTGRNDPCPCGSGKKYKKCHGL
ncbi:SEC-C domain-containing protein [bacterium]|nr:SEC-C domain-containing protein [bacterium]MCI0602129.1 SEC-C domain-containing protein [bacterium]